MTITRDWQNGRMRSIRAASLPTRITICSTCWHASASTKDGRTSSATIT